jgi:hypothetical protein
MHIIHRTRVFKNQCAIRVSSSHQFFKHNGGIVDVLGHLVHIHVHSVVGLGVGEYESQVFQKSAVCRVSEREKTQHIIFPLTHTLSCVFQTNKVWNKGHATCTITIKKYSSAKPVTAKRSRCLLFSLQLFLDGSEVHWVSHIHRVVRQTLRDRSVGNNKQQTAAIRFTIVIVITVLKTNTINNNR